MSDREAPDAEGSASDQDIVDQEAKEQGEIDRSSAPAAEKVRARSEVRAEAHERVGGDSPSGPAPS